MTALSVTVLCPNGRRVNVKVTANTSILQIIEDACKNGGFDPDRYDLKHLRRVLDISSTVRYTGLPNKCQLELIKSETPRTSGNVIVNIATDSGQRLVHEFPATTSLWEILLHHEQSGKVGSLLPSPEGDLEPVIVYTMRRISGKELRTATLKALGLTSGKCMFRYSVQSVFSKSQAHVSAPLSRSKTSQQDDEWETMNKVCMCGRVSNKWVAAMNHQYSSRRQVVSIMWPTEKTLELIELLHSMPALWDIASQDYKNKLKKADALKEVADRLSVQVSDVDKKIRALKIQFRREHVKLILLKRSGTSPKKCAWFGYEPLMFLLQGQESRGSRRTDSTLINEVDEEVESEQEIDTEIEGPHQDETLKTASHPCRSLANKRTDDKLDEAFQVMKTLTENATKRDEYHVFGEHVAHKLRNSGKSRHEVSIAQHKINEVLFILEMGYFGQGITHYPQHTSYSGNSYSGLPLATSPNSYQYSCGSRGTPSPSGSPSPSAHSMHSDLLQPTPPADQKEVIPQIVPQAEPHVVLQDPQQHGPQVQQPPLQPAQQERQWPVHQHVDIIPEESPDLVSSSQSSVPDVVQSQNNSVQPDITDRGECMESPIPMDLSEGHDVASSSSFSGKPVSASVLPEERVIKLGSHNAILFSMEDAPRTITTDEDDSFFQLSVDEISKLYQEQQKILHDMEEAPLMTQQMREMEESSKVLSALNQYPVTHLRIYFPDDHVIQASFKPTDTVATVMDFIKPFLVDRTLEFNLCTRHPSRVLSADLTLVSADCVPNARLYFECPAATPPYFNNDTLAKKSSFSSAYISLGQRKQHRQKQTASSSEEFHTVSSNQASTNMEKTEENHYKRTNMSNQTRGAIPKVPKWFKTGK